MGGSRQASAQARPADPWDGDRGDGDARDRDTRDRDTWDGDAWDATQAGLPTERLALVDLLDRVLAGGVVITGDITLSIADVDLVVISLRALLTSVSKLVEPVTGETRGISDG